MMMTDSEIRAAYRGAKRPREQIKILAQLNLCSEEKIMGIVAVSDPPKYAITKEQNPNRQPWKITPKTEAEFSRLYSLGKSDAAIASACMCSAHSVRLWRERAELPPNYLNGKKVVSAGKPRERPAEPKPGPKSREIWNYDEGI